MPCVREAAPSRRILRPASPRKFTKSLSQIRWSLRCRQTPPRAGWLRCIPAAHSAQKGMGTGSIRPCRPEIAFLSPRPSALRFPIMCSSRQRLRCAQPLARRRMAAQRFCRLLTLSDLISAISEPVLRSVFGFALAPLRGSLRQQPRGAAVSAAMVAPCADEVLRAAVVMRKRFFMR